MQNFLKYRKFYIAFIGFATALLAEGIVPESWEGYVGKGITVLSLAGVWFFPNAEDAPDDADDE